MNSFYGVMGSDVSRFFHTDLANAITGTAKYLLLETKAYLSESGHKVVYGDTDSLFVSVNKNLFLYSGYQKFGKDLIKHINNFWKNKLSSEFGLDSYLEIEFEDYFTSFLLPKARSGTGAAKKRYAGLKVDGNIYFTGMESKRSDWSPLAKKFQNEFYLKIFNNEPYIKWARDFVSDLKKGLYNEFLVFSKRIRKPISDYKKMVPPHIQAARRLKKTQRKIKYVICKRGPIPIELEHSDYDYDYYILKQIAPVADSILTFKHTSLKKLLDLQLDLFIDQKHSNSF